MREIEFKGIIQGTNAWIYGLPYAVYSDNNIDSIQSIKTKQVEYIKTDTLSQFTGLKDKNGVKIFEGDIIESEYKGERFVIKFWEGSFVGDNSNFKYGILSSHEIERSEVIGNIHQNLELLS